MYLLFIDPTIIHHCLLQLALAHVAVDVDHMKTQSRAACATPDQNAPASHSCQAGSAVLHESFRALSQAHSGSHQTFCADRAMCTARCSGSAAEQLQLTPVKKAVAIAVAR